MPPALAKRVFSATKVGLRSIERCLIAERRLDHLQAIRARELDVVATLLPRQGKLLEIGAGTGWQAQALSQRGYEVCAVDLPASNYAEHRVFSVLDYDGYTLPFGDREFEIVYSSNLLEHVPHLVDFQREIHRVLRPGGYVVHVLPSSSWRFWTNVTHVIRYRSWPLRHGEHAANAFDEIIRFSRREWRRIFRATGWTVATELPNRLFYTGNSILDARLSIGVRTRLSAVLGSSCNVFVLRELA